VVALAHHQLATVLVMLLDERGQVSVHLRGQRLGQHPPGTLRMIPSTNEADEPPATASSPPANTGATVSCEHGSYLPDRRVNVGLLEIFTRSPGRYALPLIHRFQALLAVLL